MLLTTLRYDRTVRKPDTVFDDIEAEKADPKMVKLARDVIEKKMKKFDPSTFVDPYQEALHEFVEKKKAGRKPAKKKAAAAERPSNVVNLFDALKRSLGTGKAVPGGRAAGARPKAARKKPARKQRSA